MEQTEPRNGFTNKEMWVRVDGKLDVVIAKQNHYDVELALLKARQDEYDRATSGGENWRKEVRERIDHIDAQAEDVRTKQKVTAYLVAAVVTISTVVTPVVLKLVG